MTPDLTHADARAMIDRGIAKARELHQAGAFVVMDAAGNVISISVMEGSITSSLWVSRAKAYVSAVQREPSARRAANWHTNTAGFSAYQRLMRDEIFAGPGGMPIRRGGQVIGSISTGGGIGPSTEIPGVDPGLLMAEGQPANGEDLIISTALGTPYQNQHPDVQKLVGRRVEVTPDERPRTLAVARAIADRAIEEATARGVRVGVAVLDELGQPVQMDRTDGAGLIAHDIAEALARTALNFQCASSEVSGRYDAQQFAQVQGLTRYKLLSGPGGVPIVQDGWVVGALGVSGSGRGDLDEEIARAAAGAAEAAAAR